MGYHSIQRKLETSCATYLAALGTVYKSEQADEISERQMIVVTAPRADGHAVCPGNYSVELMVEVRTNLNLYTDRATAATAHWSLWESVADKMMMDDLKDQLDGSGLGINGIDPQNQLTQRNENGTLINSITRTIHTVSDTITA